ncbi:MAG: hypothetical protein R2932_17530 [Caldilineaceae bacterium]
MKAINLRQVVKLFDPQSPLTGNELNLWFVQRPQSPRDYMRVALQNAQDAQDPIRMLLVGHRGSGKSTELNKLVTELDNEYAAVPFNVVELTGRSAIHYQDLMLVLGTQLIRYCIDAQLINRPLADPLREGWQTVADWWQRLVAGLPMYPQGDVSTYVKLGTLLGEIEVGARESAYTRDMILEQVDRRMPELIEHVNWAIGEAQKQLNPRRLLLVIEGLDKIDLEPAREIFRDHTQTITALHCTTIFTFPLALRYSDDYNTVQRHFHPGRQLHNLSLNKPNGEQDGEGRACLRHIILNRMERSLIGDAALDVVIQGSGGIVVDLIRLVNSAATYAQVRDSAATQIELADVQLAIRDRQRDWPLP